VGTNCAVQWTKQVASHLGGTRNPMVLAWPSASATAAACATHATLAGSAMPAPRGLVGNDVVPAWPNCGAQAAAVADALGQASTMGLRVPPRCEATCLVHWNGAFVPQASRRCNAR